ncbi:MAG: serine kinase [Rhodobacteraceae bacterium]|nr:MAG: serine kinase [Paracoccaceae bacterium]
MTGPTAPDGPGAAVVLHASAVAWAGRGLLILGPSGAGKSALALQLMAWGAALVADDRTEVSRQDGRLWAKAPPAIAGMIEARGVGLLAADPAGPVPLSLAVDLSATETERLPPLREITLLDTHLPLVHRVESGHFPAAVLQYLKGGRSG